jgi:hypothetical protein
MEAIAGGCIGFVLGALIGAALGLGIGFDWIDLIQTSCFEGYCGMLVFFTFVPIGAIGGGLAGAIAPGSFDEPQSLDLIPVAASIRQNACLPREGQRGGPSGSEPGFSRSNGSAPRTASMKSSAHAII